MEHRCGAGRMFFWRGRWLFVLIVCQNLSLLMLEMYPSYMGPYLDEHGVAKGKKVVENTDNNIFNFIISFPSHFFHHPPPFRNEESKPLNHLSKVTNNKGLMLALGPTSAWLSTPILLLVE
jgi:hypothetical protein